MKNTLHTRFFILAGIVILLLNIVFCSFVANAEPTEDELTSSGSDDKVDVLIGFFEPPGRFRQMIEAAGGDIYREFKIINVIAARLKPQAVEVLARNPVVRYIEPDELVYATELSASSSTQTIPWGINRVFGPEEYPFATWDFSKGEGIAVAVLDTGIDENHVDLPNLLGGVTTVDSTHWGADVHGHGTHVAGTIAALDNDYGVVGVVPLVGLYAVKVLDDSGIGATSAVAAGIEWAVLNEIPVINMSLGSSSSSTTLRDACNAAYNAGHLLISSAGNAGNVGGGGDNVSYPARHETVVAVASSTINDTRSSTSSTGPAVELIAPGNAILSTYPGDLYATASGTSMASPHVAGVAALIWAFNPHLTNVEIRSILRETAEDLGLPANHQGYGLVRADLAIAAIPEPPFSDLAITEVSARAEVIEGEIVEVTVRLENYGNQAITGDIGLILIEDYEQSVIESRNIEIDLAVGEFVDLYFLWDTAGKLPGIFSITAGHNFSDDNPDNDSGNILITIEDVEWDFTLTLAEGWNLLSLPQWADKIGFWERNIDAWLAFDNGVWVSSGDLKAELNNPVQSLFIKTNGFTEVRLKWLAENPEMTFAEKILNGGWNLIGTGMQADYSALLANVRFDGENTLTQLFAPNLFNSRKGEGFYLHWNIPLVNLLISGYDTGEEMYPLDGYWVYLRGDSLTYSTPVEGLFHKCSNRYPANSSFVMYDVMN
ncbi:MAG: S8 family serine peptidase [Bacillota bacterium]|nr:S8 family serine peptidase [Bacillota bacterium]